MAGPEAILRAATHGLVLGALWGDGPLPEEQEELRNRLPRGWNESGSGAGYFDPESIRDLVKKLY